MFGNVLREIDVFKNTSFFFQITPKSAIHLPGEHDLQELAATSSGDTITVRSPRDSKKVESRQEEKALALVKSKLE